MLEGMGRGIYRVMREHPHWMPLVAHDSGIPPSGLPLIDELLGLMLTDGFVLEDALRAYGCVMSFALGSVQFERMMTGAGDVAAKRLASLKELGRTSGTYANLASVAAKVDRWRWDDVVELGFESLLTGIEAKYVRPERRLKGRPRRAT